MGKDHGVVNNERVTVRNVAYRQLHSHLTLHYWAYNTKRIVPTYIDVVAWKHAEKVTQFSSSVTLEEEENERIGFSSNPEQILLFFYRFSLRFRRDASQSRFQSRELTDRVNPNKFQEFSFRQLPSPPPLFRNLEPRTKISFSPRSKNRENRKWGNTRTKNNWKK